MFGKVVKRVMLQQQLSQSFSAPTEVPFLVQVQQYFDKAAALTDIPADRLKYPPPTKPIVSTRRRTRSYNSNYRWFGMMVQSNAFRPTVLNIRRIDFLLREALALVST
jgi:hypothetical protein